MLISRVARVKPIQAAKGGQKKFFTVSSPVRTDFTHVVIGGGVVGLAAAQRLSSRPGTSTLLLERNALLGTETSSRNSEVIHAGIYYGARSLKAKLCIRGRRLLYPFCEKHAVPHRNTGKWIVAQTEGQLRALEDMHGLCTRELDVPVRWVAREEVAREGEGAVRAEMGCLESPTTGIVDSHALMVALRGLVEENGGFVAVNSSVRHVVPLGSSPKGSAGWEITVEDTGSSRETSTITTETIINAAGLGAVDVHNMIVPEGPERRRLYYAKGNYFSYSSSRPRVSRLIYPAPEPGAAGLGTHLTLDLAGRLRFGPDVEWVDSPDDLAANPARMDEAVREIRRYLPGVHPDALEADYAGIRPKLTPKGAVGAGKGFLDFYIRKEEGYEGWVNLLGIESPGLTSSLAIGEMVEELLYGNVMQK